MAGRKVLTASAAGLWLYWQKEWYQVFRFAKQQHADVAAEFVKAG
jgi:hypothetical protein